MAIDIKADVSETTNKLLAKPADAASGAIATVVTFFHNTVLLPMQKYNIKANLNLKKYQADLKKEIDKIPDSKKAEPNMNIWGQTMDSLKWNMDDEQEYIRDMFTKILTSDINEETKNKVQPAFIEIVRQLSKNDARILAEIFKKHPTANLYEQRLYHRTVGQPKPSEYSILRRYVAIIDRGLLEAEFEKSLDNIKRLGIISESDGYWGNRQLAKKFEISGEWQRIKNDANKETLIEIVQNKKLQVTDFGKDFLDICFK